MSMTHLKAYHLGISNIQLLAFNSSSRKSYALSKLQFLKKIWGGAKTYVPWTRENLYAHSVLILNYSLF